MVIEKVKEEKNFNINKNNVSEKEKVLELARKDIIAFGQLFMPEDFMKSTPAPYHYELNNLLLNPNKKRICVILPRGHSKSTLAKTALLHHLYFNPPHLFPTSQLLIYYPLLFFSCYQYYSLYESYYN